MIGEKSASSKLEDSESLSRSEHSVKSVGLEERLRNANLGLEPKHNVTQGSCAIMERLTRGKHRTNGRHTMIRETNESHLF